MKHSVLLAILMACVLCVGDVAAGDRVQRSRSRQVQKVVVEKEKVVIKKEVAQPVLLLQQKGYYQWLRLRRAGILLGLWLCAAGRHGLLLLWICPPPRPGE
jgi:hypothetical protein